MEHFSNAFCQMQLYERFVILVMNENITLTLEKAFKVRQKLREYYKSKDFLMISYRKYNHNVSPEVYKQGQLDNMKGLAIVSNDEKQRDKAISEQPLYDRSFVFFNRLEEAKSWAEGYF